MIRSRGRRVRPVGGSRPRRNGQKGGAMRVLGALAGLLFAFCPGPAAADHVVPGVLYALGEKFDNSFNESAYNALERFKAETGIEYLEFAPETVSAFVPGVEAMIRRGANPIIVVGHHYPHPLPTRAAPTPD